MADVEYIRRIVSRVAESWPKEKAETAFRILDKLADLDEDRADEVIKREIMEFIKQVNKSRECLDSGGSVSKCGHPVKLLVDWLDSPSGIIAYSYMWRPEFAEKMVRLIATSLVLAERVVSVVANSIS